MTNYTTMTMEQLNNALYRAESDLRSAFWADSYTVELEETADANRRINAIKAEMERRG